VRACGESGRLVTALCVQAKSPFHTQGANCYDKARDAFLFPGGTPVIAMPPCQQWCRLRRFSTYNLHEMALGLHCVRMVKTWGGVLEQPAQSALFRTATLPAPGQEDATGFTVSVDQFNWGHRARKRTWLFVAGLSRGDMPGETLRLGRPTHCVGGSSTGLLELGASAADATPPEFAAWLLQVARLTRPMHLPKAKNPARTGPPLLVFRLRK
jgi:hypothetical protein